MKVAHSLSFTGGERSAKKEGVELRDEGDRLLTVLFTDTEASTALQAAVGDEAAFEIVTECNALTCHEIERFDGRIVKDLGDGIMAAFDSPRRAVMTAL